MKKTVVPLITAGIVGLGTPATIGTHYLTKESILDKVGEDVLPNRDGITEEDWNLLKPSLTNIPNLKGQHIKDWCINAYLQTYDSAFESKKEKILSDVKKVCILKIKTKLGSQNIFEVDQINKDKNKDAFVKKIEKLSGDSSNFIDLNEELKAIKLKGKESESWKDLESWCVKVYERGYTGPETVLWKLSEMFCKKDF